MVEYTSPTCEHQDYRGKHDSLIDVNAFITHVFCINYVLCADFSNEISDDVEKYFQLTNLDSKDRVGLFRLAHDVAISGFGSRQALYERYFFGPPALMASSYYDLYQKDDLIDRIDNFLKQ